VYTDNLNGTVSYKYNVIDSSTGSSVFTSGASAALSANSSYGTLRVFIVGNYFVIVYVSVGNALVYLALSTSNPDPTSISTGIINGNILTTAGYAPFDGYVASDGNLYVAYTSTTPNTQIRTLSPALSVSSATIISNTAPQYFALTQSLSTRGSTPVIYLVYYQGVGATVGYVAGVDYTLTVTLSPVQIISSAPGSGYVNFAIIAPSNSDISVYAEVSNGMAYDGAVPDNYLQRCQLNSTGTILTSINYWVRTMGMASKAFYVNGNKCLVGTYSSLIQPTYFILTDVSSGSTNLAQPISRLAYGSGGGYYTPSVPAVTVSGNMAYFPYLYKEYIQASALTANGIYGQLGVNYASYNFAPATLTTAEIANTLNMSGGFVQSYDGLNVTEQNFWLFPDRVEATWSTTGGSIAAQPGGGPGGNSRVYWYQVTYEWVDNQGNLQRSAPSIAVPVTTTGSGTTGSITLYIPCLQLTYKTNVTICIYRWSVGQQIYYQTTSITSPLLSVKSIDYATFVDTNSDTTIAGNNILYTTGGVVQDNAPPATDVVALFDARMWLVDAEDRNLLWFSKQAIEATPIEFSDLFTLYIPPTTATEGSTGPITALYPMDDKLIVFKANAIGYIAGAGPDNTGSNNAYTNFILITSACGCTNPNSIALTPQGLMFQSSKGIWLLDRSLNASYIGAEVEGDVIGNTVLSALNVPNSNQIRFSISTGIILLYDYYYGQWGKFSIPLTSPLSGVIYQGLHTFIANPNNNAAPIGIFQETPGIYYDGPMYDTYYYGVAMSFNTAWINLAGLQGFERFYYLNLLGSYISPFTLSANFAYDYNPTPSTGAATITPDTSNAVFEAKIFPSIQKCSSFQLQVAETQVSSVSTAGFGAGYTLSGCSAIAGFKKVSRTNSAARQFAVPSS
jgi:hypothetical protein